MGASDNSASPKEVELIQEIQRPTKKSKREKEPLEVVITFWTHVGWDGALILFCMLGMSGIFLYITYVYTRWYSRNFGRKYVWFFPLMAGLYVVKLFLSLRKWKSKAVLFTKDETIDRSKMTLLEQIVAIKILFQIYGPYYLWKLYTTEMMESILQIHNLFQIYLCSMPVGFSAVLCMCLAVDCFHCALFMMRATTADGRDRQYKIDGFVDFLSTAAPICIIWFGYNVPISIEETLSLTLLPAFLLMLKLSTMFEEIIRSRSAKRVLKFQTEYVQRCGRRRRSIFGENFRIGDIVEVHLRYKMWDSNRN